MHEYSAERLRALTAEIKCKVCGETSRLTDVVDFARQCNVTTYPDGLSGWPVYYATCSGCGLVFTNFFDRFTSDEWSRYVYNEDYARIDPDYTGRRARLSVPLVRAAARDWFSATDRGCDFGGGRGTLAELLGQSGLSYDCFDPYGKQALTRGPGSYALVSAFEVLEHVPNPVEVFGQLADLLAREKGLLFVSTMLADGRSESGKLVDWWYAAPRNGHITLYSEATLKRLAAQHGMDYLRVTRGLHLFGRGLDLPRIRRRVLTIKVLQRLHLS